MQLVEQEEETQALALAPALACTWGALTLPVPGETCMHVLPLPSAQIGHALSLKVALACEREPRRWSGHWQEDRQRQAYLPRVTPSLPLPVPFLAAPRLGAPLSAMAPEGPKESKACYRILSGPSVRPPVPRSNGAGGERSKPDAQPAPVPEEAKPSRGITKNLHIRPIRGLLC